MRRSLLLAGLLLLALSFAWAQQSSPPAPADKGKKNNPQDVLQSEQFSDTVASALLGRIADGFTRRNPGLFLSAFDAQRFPGYPLFADRVRARLGQNYDFRAYFRILNTTSQDAQATAAVELQIEQDPTTPGPPPTRSTGQARFSFERGPGGWRIVEVAPRDLLTGTR